MKILSINENKIFKRIYTRTVGFVAPSLVLYKAKNGCLYVRLGITVSKKIGKAVKRNRIRRQFKEAFCIYANKIKPGFDVVLVARSRANNADFASIMRDVQNLLQKSNILH